MAVIARNESWVDGALTGWEEVTDNGDGTGTRIAYGANGQAVASEPLTGLAVVDDQPAPVAVVLAAVQDARDRATAAKAEVAGYSQSNGTRQAVEALVQSNSALAAAVETLVQGAAGPPA